MKTLTEAIEYFHVPLDKQAGWQEKETDKIGTLADEALGTRGVNIMVNKWLLLVAKGEHTPEVALFSMFMQGVKVGLLMNEPEMPEL